MGYRHCISRPTSCIFYSVNIVGLMSIANSPFPTFGTDIINGIFHTPQDFSISSHTIINPWYLCRSYKQNLTEGLSQSFSQYIHLPMFASVSHYIFIFDCLEPELGKCSSCHVSHDCHNVICNLFKGSYLHSPTL